MGLLTLIVFVVLLNDGPYPVFLLDTQEDCELLLKQSLVDAGCQLVKPTKGD